MRPKIISDHSPHPPPHHSIQSMTGVNKGPATGQAVWLSGKVCQQTDESKWRLGRSGCRCIWVQPPVTFPIGDHVNVLHDYKKTGPSKILKLLSCRCQHLIDTLVECCQNHIFLTLLKRLNVPHPSILTNFGINYYAHVPCGEKIPKNPSAYLNHLKIHGYTANMFYQ